MRRLLALVWAIAALMLTTALASTPSAWSQESGGTSQEVPVTWERFESDPADPDGIGLMRAEIPSGPGLATFRHDGPYLLLIEQGSVCFTVVAEIPPDPEEYLAATPQTENRCEGAMTCSSTWCTATLGQPLLISVGSTVSMSGDSIATIANMNGHDSAILIIADNYAQNYPKTIAPTGCAGGCWGRGR